MGIILLILQPIDALIVSLLDGERSIADLAYVLGYLTEIVDPQKSLSIVTGVLDRINADGNQKNNPARPKYFAPLFNI